MSDAHGAEITVVGTVREIREDGSTSPLAGALVRIADGDGGVALERTTAPDGRYGFAHLNPGRWVLTVRCKGYAAPDPIISTFSADAASPAHGVALVVHLGNGIAPPGVVSRRARSRSPVSKGIHKISEPRPRRWRNASPT